MFTMVLYGLAIISLSVSFWASPKRTGLALKKSWKALNNMLPEFIAVLILVGLIITVLTPETISRFIGQDTGLWGMALASVVGAITLIPGFVAFPLASSLLEHGAGLTQIAVFVSTLMMVGVVTAPLEIRYFGYRHTLWRNGLSFALSFLVAYLLGVMV